MECSHTQCTQCKERYGFNGFLMSQVWKWKWSDIWQQQICLLFGLLLQCVYVCVLTVQALDVGRSTEAIAYDLVWAVKERWLISHTSHSTHPSWRHPGSAPCYHTSLIVAQPGTDHLSICLIPVTVTTYTYPPIFMVHLHCPIVWQSTHVATNQPHII